MEGHLLQQHAYKVPRAQRGALEAAVLSLDVMPSMRALMTAGPALQRSNIAGYNCSYLPVDDPAAFHETLYILMNGTGVGYSVERKFVGARCPCAAHVTHAVRCAHHALSAVRLPRLCCYCTCCVRCALCGTGAPCPHHAR